MMHVMVYEVVDGGNESARRRASTRICPTGEVNGEEAHLSLSVTSIHHSLSASYHGTWWKTSLLASITLQPAPLWV